MASTALNYATYRLQWMPEDLWASALRWLAVDDGLICATSACRNLARTRSQTALWCTILAHEGIVIQCTVDSDSCDNTAAASRRIAMLCIPMWRRSRGAAVVFQSDAEVHVACAEICRQLRSGMDVWRASVVFPSGTDVQIAQWKEAGTPETCTINSTTVLVAGYQVQLSVVILTNKTLTVKAQSPTYSQTGSAGFVIIISVPALFLDQDCAVHSRCPRNRRGVACVDVPLLSASNYDELNVAQANWLTAICQEIPICILVSVQYIAME